MGRPPKFTVDAVLDAALAVVARDGGDATVEAIASELGGHVGSLYHRFGSRRELLAALWLRSVRRWHAELLATFAAAAGPGDALRDGACLIVTYCQRHPDEARALTLFRHASLLADCPPALEDDIGRLNRDVHATIGRLTEERYGRTDDRLLLLVRTASLQTAYGLVRPYIDTGEQIPPWLVELVAAAVPAMLATGEDLR